MSFSSAGLQEVLRALMGEAREARLVLHLSKSTTPHVIKVNVADFVLAELYFFNLATLVTAIEGGARVQEMKDGKTVVVRRQGSKLIVQDVR